MDTSVIHDKILILLRNIKVLTVYFIIEICNLINIENIIQASCKTNNIAFINVRGGFIPTLSLIDLVAVDTFCKNQFTVTDK